MTVAVLGPGGVGGFLAAVLADAGTDVVLIAREETAAVVARDGLRVTSSRLERSWTARPRVGTMLEEPADVLLVCTKATGLEAALERIAVVPPVVVPLLNGLDHVGLLRERWGDVVVPAAIRIEADRTAPGVIEQTSPFLRVDLAAEGVPDASALAAALEAAGVPVRLGGTEAEVLWGKLVRLNALACLTTARRGTLGDVRADPVWAARLEGAIVEGSAVAAAAGSPVAAAEVRAEIDAIPGAFTSSMSRDVEAGREPELDAIAGAVLRAADRFGVAVPTVRALREEIAGR